MILNFEKTWRCFHSIDELRLQKSLCLSYRRKWLSLWKLYGSFIFYSILFIPVERPYEENDYANNFQFVKLKLY